LSARDVTRSGWRPRSAVAQSESPGAASGRLVPGFERHHQRLDPTAERREKIRYLTKMRPAVERMLRSAARAPPRLDRRPSPALPRPTTSERLPAAAVGWRRPGRARPSRSSRVAVFEAARRERGGWLRRLVDALPDRRDEPRDVEGVVLQRPPSDRSAESGPMRPYGLERRPALAGGGESPPVASLSDRAQEKAHRSAPSSSAFPSRGGGGRRARSGCVEATEPGVAPPPPAAPTLGPLSAVRLLRIETAVPSTRTLGQLSCAQGLGARPVGFPAPIRSPTTNVGRSLSQVPPRRVGALPHGLAGCWAGGSKKPALLQPASVPAPPCSSATYLGRFLPRAEPCARPRLL